MLAIAIIEDQDVIRNACATYLRAQPEFRVGIGPLVVARNRPVDKRAGGKKAARPPRFRTALKCG